MTACRRYPPHGVPDIVSHEQGIGTIHGNADWTAERSALSAQEMGDANPMERPIKIGAKSIAPSLVASK